MRSAGPRALHRVRSPAPGRPTTLKILRVLLAGALLPAAHPAWSQAARLTGAVDVDLLQGRVAADVCLRGAPVRGDTTWFALHRGMNVKRVRNTAGRALPFSTTYRDQALHYAVRDTAAAGGDGVCVEYTGAYPVYDVRADDYRDGDGSGVIAFNGTTLRARGESRWYPAPLDAAGAPDDHLAYRLRVRCAACTRLYVNGAPPAPGPEAELASDVPRELLLWIGDYPAARVDGTWFLGETVAEDTARLFLARVGEIQRFYEGFVGVPYGPTPDVLRIIPVSIPVSRFGRYQFWGFLADPALGLAGRITIGDFVQILGDPQHPGRAPLLGVLAHELAHRYFAGALAPAGPYSQLFGEPFSNYLDLHARRRFFGEEAYRAGVRAMRERALDGPDLPALDTAAPAEIASDRYRYAVAPLLLVALESEVGEARMRAFLRALLTTPAAERDPLDYAAMRRIALRSGIPAAAWERWEERCVRPPLSRSECLRNLR